MSLFGEDVFFSSLKFNRAVRFTDEQIKIIESTCRELLDSVYDMHTKKRFVERLDSQRAVDIKSAALCFSWHFILDVFVASPL